jgi:hypothetical protein
VKPPSGDPTCDEVEGDPLRLLYPFSFMSLGPKSWTRKRSRASLTFDINVEPSVQILV